MIKRAFVFFVGFISLLFAESVDSLLLQLESPSENESVSLKDSITNQFQNEFNLKEENSVNDEKKDSIVENINDLEIIDKKEVIESEKSPEALGIIHSDKEEHKTESVFSVQADLNAEKQGTKEFKDTISQKSTLFKELSQKEEIKKIVLYLSGGENSPWYHLGALYAIESYGISIDSVVGTSWGAYIGYLWSHGMELDDIQQALRDSHLQNFVGHNMFDKLYKNNSSENSWPISEKGIPSLRYRVSLENDSLGILRGIPQKLKKDTTFHNYELAKLRFQEVLNRPPSESLIPFSIAKCKEEKSNTVQDVFREIPLIENENTGELCPLLALPIEDVYGEIPLLVIAIPKRTELTEKYWKSPWQKNLSEQSLESIHYSSAILVRPHNAKEANYSAWIQNGFSDMERHITEIHSFKKDSINYKKLKKHSKPWFKFNPTFDSLSAETHSVANSYWESADTGMVAPEHFLRKISEEPTFDSIYFDMQSTGDLLIGGNVNPIVDVALGGFGSNAIGPQAYGEMSFYYVNQLNFALTFSSFFGGNSYGIEPMLKISRLWSKNWNLGLKYNYINLKPLKSYLNDNTYYSTPQSEKRKDFNLWIDYFLTSNQKVSLDILLGNRDVYFAKVGGVKNVETWPVMPSLSYSLETSDFDNFFDTNGYKLTLQWALQSVRYKLGISDLIPIYNKLTLEAQFNQSVTSFMTLGILASTGIDFFHDEGHGYVYPKSTGLLPLDNFYRRQIVATPWNGEWYNPELLSHHYGLIRLKWGVYKKSLGMWIFGAYIHDFEDNSTSYLNKNKFILEPALRFAYKSISVYSGISRIVDKETFSDITKISDWTFFVRIGNYNLF